MRRVLCLDANVVVKHLVMEEGHDAATSLIVDALREGADLIAPSWAWAEIGTVLRKKVRSGLLTVSEATTLWNDFASLSIDYVDESALRVRAWTLAEQFGLSTLYDAAFLACADLSGDGAEFWTADHELIKQLGRKRPSYVRELGA